MREFDRDQQHNKRTEDFKNWIKNKTSSPPSSPGRMRRKKRQEERLKKKAPKDPKEVISHLPTASAWI